MTWGGWLDRELAQIRARDHWRSCRAFDASAGLSRSGRLGEGGAPVVSFASNDYLALSSHPEVVAAAHSALDRWGAGSGSSRLVVGTRPVHAELEAALAAWKGAEAALVFPTGYAANTGVLAALGGDEVTVFSDELNHASIVDGCRLSRARVVVYPHLDVGALGDMLRRSPGRALVVSESVFSMDGDVVPLGPLLATCAESGALLVLDEAHAVLGPAVGAPPPGLELVLVGTLSKALGSLGGFVAAPRRWVDWLVNRARPFIFTTAPTPADTAAALAAVGIVQAPEGTALLRRLRANIDALRPGHPSPIIPVVLGAERRALEASAALLRQGLLVPAIRPPSVPAGTSRLRIALSAAHTSDHLARLAGALGELGLDLSLGPSAWPADPVRPAGWGGPGGPGGPGGSGGLGGPGHGRSADRADGGTEARRPQHTMARPERLVARSVRLVMVLGTGTGVGKTWVAAALLTRLRADGLRVAARKPAQSFVPGERTDAEILGEATGEAPAEVCPPWRWYERPMAPPMAAESLGRPAFSISDLAEELAWPEGADFGLVEGAGGVRSPLAADGDAVDLLAALHPALIVLVAGAGLGTLNLVRLAADALTGWPVVVYLNWFDAGDELQCRNRDWLAGRAGLQVVSSPGQLLSTGLIWPPAAGPR